MKHTVLLSMVMGLFALSGQAADVPLGDWGTIAVPEKYETGVAFPIKVNILTLEQPTKMVVTANWKKTNRQFGGFLQMLGISKDITGPGSHEFNVKITKTKPDLAAVVLAVYLSPDGEWQHRTVHGIAEIPLAKAVTDLAAAQSEQTGKAKPFVLESAPMVAGLEEGGFGEEPAMADAFDPGWPKQNLWRVATWKQNKTQMSPERCRVNADGHLVQTVLQGLPGQGGSMQSTREFGWGRWTARLKPTSVPGVLNSMFTKDWDDLSTPESESDGKMAEIDIELLSHSYGPNRGEVHLAIHLKNRPNLWHVDVPLDFNPSDAFHVWGFDVLPDRVIWHVDGRFLAEWEYTAENCIDPGYEMFFNSWTMEKWIKGPPQQDADYLIDWVRFYPLKKAQ